MPRKPPSYRLHKPSGQAVVTLDGWDHYLGRHGTPESHADYDRLVAEWLANGRRLPGPEVASAGLTVNEVLLAFWKHAKAHYRGPGGEPALELANVRDAIRPLRRLYGHTSARAFGPLALRAVRDAMVASGLARTTVNARVNRIRRVFRWAASVELVPAAVHDALCKVEGLQQGRTAAREAGHVAPAPAADVEAALPLLPRPVAAMVRLQLLTGCRAGEVMAMRGRDLAPGDPTWEYRPAHHKNAWRGQGRVIPLGPKAQAIVREFLKPGLEAYLFSPRDVVADLRDRRLGGRPPDRVAARYDRRGYRQAIVRASRKAGVPEWSPLQLRHAAATAIRARYGLEAAQVVLGHAKADTTEIYAERDLDRARTIMGEIG
jgi:integrase